MKTKSAIPVPITLAALLLPTLAQAHPGHGATGFSSGLTHPLLGWDHLLAMVAVGLWASQLDGRARWAVPAAFVGAMTLGGMLGVSGVSLPLAEFGIILSVLTLGVLIAASIRLPSAASATLVGVFALCHGFAHGAEMPLGASVTGYAFGFVVTTAGLHLAGLAAGLGLQQAAHAPWQRLTGAAICLGGVMLSIG
jgi:urease accessory protein